MALADHIQRAYLNLLDWFARFLIWFSEALESLFGSRVRDGVINSAHHRQDSFEKFGSANFSFPTTNVCEPTEGDPFPRTSQSGRGLNSANEPDDMVTPFCDHVPLSEPDPGTATGIKPFDPYDPQDLHSVFNGDPLNFDPAYHPDHFDTI